DQAAVHGITDLRGHRVGTLGGSLSHDFVAAVPGIEVVPYEGTQEPYLDLEEGRIDGVVLDDIIAQRYGLVRPRLRDAGAGGEGGGGRGRVRDRHAVRRAVAATRGRRGPWGHGARRRAARDPGALESVERPAGGARHRRRGAGRAGRRRAHRGPARSLPARD